MNNEPENIEWPKVKADGTKHPIICLHEPEIPQNSGNIGRLAAATACPLRLIKPLGFSLDDRYLKRAGLDYWPYLDYKVHENFAEFKNTLGPKAKIAILTTKAEKAYTEIDSDVDVLIFGKESAGVPESMREEYEDSCYTIPMFHSKVRSLNLANAVSIVLYNTLAKKYTR